VEEKEGKQNEAEGRRPAMFNTRELPFTLAVFVAGFLAQMGLLLIGKAAGWEAFENVGLRVPLIVLAVFTLRQTFRDMFQRFFWLAGGVACALAGTLVVMLVVALLPTPNPESLYGWMLRDLAGLLVSIAATVVPLWLLAHRLQGGDASP